jgi:hypothetical protein
MLSEDVKEGRRSRAWHPGENDEVFTQFFADDVRLGPPIAHRLMAGQRACLFVSLVFVPDTKFSVVVDMS